MTAGVGAGITWLQIVAVATGAVFGALLRASTQRAPAGVTSFFQNGAWVFR